MLVSLWTGLFLGPALCVLEYDAGFSLDWSVSGPAPRLSEYDLVSESLWTGMFLGQHPVFQSTMLVSLWTGLFLGQHHWGGGAYGTGPPPGPART